MEILMSLAQEHIRERKEECVVLVFLLEKAYLIWKLAWKILAFYSVQTLTNTSH